MNYENTFFGKLPMTMYGACGFGKTYWLHSYVKVGGGFFFMNEKNKDGSIDVIGYRQTALVNPISFGSSRKDLLQKSIKEHAEKLAKEGASIVRQTRNVLVARWKNEEAVYKISPMSDRVFFKKELEG